MREAFISLTSPPDASTRDFIEFLKESFAVIAGDLREETILKPSSAVTLSVSAAHCTLLGMTTIMTAAGVTSEYGAASPT